MLWICLWSLTCDCWVRVQNSRWLCGQGREKFVRHFVVSFFLRAGENLWGSNRSGTASIFLGLLSCFCSKFLRVPLLPPILTITM